MRGEGILDQVSTSVATYLPLMGWTQRVYRQRRSPYVCVSPALVLFHPFFSPYSYASCCDIVFSLAYQAQPPAPCTVFSSQTWYAVLDNSVNYCNLHNLVSSAGLRYSSASRCFRVCLLLLQHARTVFAKEGVRVLSPRTENGEPSHFFMRGGWPILRSQQFSLLEGRIV